MGDGHAGRGHGKILGGGIVGPNAGDLIGEVALAIEMGADAVDIGKNATDDSAPDRPCLPALAGAPVGAICATPLRYDL